MARRHARDARRAPRPRVRDCRAAVRGMGLGRIGSAIVAGMVLLVTLWFVALPFSLADLWWQHHWGLGPFDVLAWLERRSGRRSRPRSSRRWRRSCSLVGLAGRFRRWWLIAAPVIVVIAAFFAFVSGLARGSSSHPLHEPRLASDAARLARVEHVAGHAGARPGRLVVDEPGERIHRRLRPVDERRSLEHAPRRALQPRRAGCRRRPRARPRAQPPHRQGDRLDGADRAPDAVAARAR